MSLAVSIQKNIQSHLMLPRLRFFSSLLSNKLPRGVLSANKASKSSKHPNAKAISISDFKEISPLRSKRLILPKLTPERNAKPSCVRFCSKRLPLALIAISCITSCCDFSIKDNILSPNIIIYHL